MNNYIEAVCIGKPMGLPEYDEEFEQWVVFFEESETPWNPMFERDVVSYYCDSADEACEIYNHYNENPVEKERENEEVTSEDIALA
jgi:hypothetical protein